jgi:hypothetical protein
MTTDRTLVDTPRGRRLETSRHEDEPTAVDALAGFRAAAECGELLDVAELPAVYEPAAPRTFL